MKKIVLNKKKLEYKTKYDNLQEEIRLILFDRAKLEQELIADAEARLRVLQTKNRTLLALKDQHIKTEFESLTQHLNKVESDKLDVEQCYHNQHEEITDKQQHSL
ncbi:unnamed protein product, partial [Rotaria sp. Silwood1]